MFAPYHVVPTERIWSTMDDSGKRSITTMSSTNE